MTRKSRCVEWVKFEKEEEWVDEPASAQWKRRALFIALGLAILAGGGALWYWRAQGQAADARVERREKKAVMIAQLKEAREAAETPELAPDVLVQRLERLASLQREATTLSPGEQSAQLQELRRTEARLGQLHARLTLEKSEASERRAAERLSAGDTEGAVAALREALKGQRDVNADATESPQNFDREVRLNGEISRLLAEPLAAVVKQRTAEAQAAVAAGDWRRALAGFREAREAQERLNHEFPRSRYSDVQAIARLDDEIASLTADGMDAQVTEHLDRARVLSQQAKRDAAVEELAAAAATQRELNERYARSRFVSMQRLEQIEAERQTLLAAELWAAVREKQQDALRQLRQRQILNAQNSVHAGHELLERALAQFPKARGQDDALRVQLVFLELRAGELGAIQDRLYDQLAPLPGASGALLKTEVLQADFFQLLNTNPSRNRGPDVPVDSVTFSEAEEFCRRLGWVLGWRVRLPTEAEMRVALANSAEFKSVIAGLDEWLAPTQSGGADMPVWQADGKTGGGPRNERVRTRGFRVLVEVDLARLGENR